MTLLPCPPSVFPVHFYLALLGPGPGAQGPRPGARALGSSPWAPGPGPRAPGPGPGLWAPALGPRPRALGPWPWVPGPRPPSPRRWAPGSGPGPLAPRSWPWAPGHWVLGPWVPRPGPWAPGPGPWAPMLRNAVKRVGRGRDLPLEAGVIQGFRGFACCPKFPVGSKMVEGKARGDLQGSPHIMDVL